jgi:DHA2 family multidrug resistance protein-like MFS transporter
LNAKAATSSSGCWITAAGILLTTTTFLLARQYLIAAFVGFTLFGIGLGLYATPSTDAALSNVPPDKAGSASAESMDAGP